MPRAFRLLQFSDIHLLAEGRLRADIDALANLEAVYASVLASGIRPEALILTGDLVDKGEPAAYRALRERTRELTGQLGCEVIFVPGNHDDRQALRATLLGMDGGGDSGGEGGRAGGEGGRAGGEGGRAGGREGGRAGGRDGACDADTIDQVAWIDGLRVVALDSVIPGRVDGELRTQQLEWLRDVLAEPAPEGTVLALHHPPIRTPIREMASMGLAEPERLAEVLRGSDVMLVICGHNHHASAGMIGGVPVWAAPATSYRSNPMNEERYEPLTGCAYSRIDITAGAAVVSYVPVEVAGYSGPAPAPQSPGRTE